MKREYLHIDGRYRSPNPEQMSKKVIGIRLPLSVDAEIREIAGEDLTQWAREALIEKLERERQETA